VLECSKLPYAFRSILQEMIQLQRSAVLKVVKIWMSWEYFRTVVNGCY
jgi:hypothetical protein